MCIFTALVIDIFVVNIIQTLFRILTTDSKKSSPKSKSTQSDWNKIDWVLNLVKYIGTCAFLLLWSLTSSL